MADFVSKKCFELLDPLLNCTVIYAKPNAPRPQAPYATIDVISRKRLGLYDERSQGTDVDGNIDITSQKEGVITVEYFGDDAEEALEILLDDLNRQSIRDKMTINMFQISRMGQVKDLTGLFASVNYEPRATVDLHFRYSTTIKDNVGIIETPIIESEFSGGVQPETN